MHTIKYFEYNKVWFLIEFLTKYKKGCCFMAINVTVTNAEAFDKSVNDAFYDITFTNTNSFNYAGSSNIYYAALLTDSTPGTALTQEVTFSIYEATQGTIAANTNQTFTFENTENLISPVTASNGRILYVAQ